MITIRRVIQTWWPLALSWLLMAAELPALSAVVARLANPEINLAAYGGIVFPLALLIESPILMLLSASTALSKDWASYRKIHRFMMVTSAALTGLHILVVFTPLYYLVVRGLLGAPQAIIEPARIGLKIMLPWTWSIAYRRFNQGVLIRFNRSQTVGVGTIIRLSMNGLVLATGYLIHTIPGIVVASSAVAVGVVSEAVYAGFAVRPVLKGELKAAPAVEVLLTWRSFFEFYIPLALTSLLGLLVQPLGSAALSRMPLALESLAVWPVVTGLVFMLRSLGFAYNEVVVALLDQPGSEPSLRRYTYLLAGATTLGILVIAISPLGRIWFSRVVGLNDQLTSLALTGLWFTLPLPGFSVLQSWFQGKILHSRRTRSITASVIIFVATCVGLQWVGVLFGKITGLYVGLFAITSAVLAQILWLWRKSKSALQSIA